MDAAPLHFNLMVEGDPEMPPEEQDALARQLLAELSETDVESAALLAAGPAPEGTKSPEAITLGALAVAVLPNFLPKLVDFVQAWALRGQGRVVKFKGKIGGQEVEFEGTADELKTVLAALGAAPAPPSAPSAAAPPASSAPGAG